MRGKLVCDRQPCFLCLVLSSLRDHVAIVRFVMRLCGEVDGEVDSKVWM